LESLSFKVSSKFMTRLEFIEGINSDGDELVKVLLGVLFGWLAVRDGVLTIIYNIFINIIRVMVHDDMFSGVEVVGIHAEVVAVCLGH